MAAAMHVSVVSANRLVWEGEGVNVIARTTEGDIGILAGHEPVLAALVPCVATVVTPEGNREVFAVDGGFISVAHNDVAILAQYATRREEISIDGARNEINELEKVMDSGDATLDQTHRYHLAQAQVKAYEATQGSSLH